MFNTSLAIRIFAISSTKPVRAELVEACSRKLRDAQNLAASLASMRLCPSTGRTVPITDSGKFTGLPNHPQIKQTMPTSWLAVQQASSSLFVRRYAVLANLLVILHRLVRHSRGVYQSAHAGLEPHGSHGLTTGRHRALVDRSGQSFVGRMPAARPATMCFLSDPT